MNGTHRVQSVSDWQRFPSEFVRAGWLKPGHEKALPHSALSTLLAIYSQLFEKNAHVSPKMVGAVVPLDQEKLARDAGGADVVRALEVLRDRGLVVRGEGTTVEVRDPISGGWPPRTFAMLPARFVVGSMPRLMEVCQSARLELGTALALYVVMLVHRNSKTTEIWYSNEKMPAWAGLNAEEGSAALAALLEAGFVRRVGLSRSWVYRLNGLSEATSPNQTTDGPTQETNAQPRAQRLAAAKKLISLSRQPKPSRKDKKSD